MILGVTIHVRVKQVYISILLFITGSFKLHQSERKAWQNSWKYVQISIVNFYTIYDKSNINKLNKHPDIEPLQDM